MPDAKVYLLKLKQHMESPQDLKLLLENRCEINEEGELVIYEEKSADARNRSLSNVVRVAGYNFIRTFMMGLSRTIDKNSADSKKWALELVYVVASFVEDRKNDKEYKAKCSLLINWITLLQWRLTDKEKKTLLKNYGPMLANSIALLEEIPYLKYKFLALGLAQFTEEAKTKRRAYKVITELNLKLRALHLVMKSDKAAAQIELSELIAQLTEKTAAGLFVAQSEIEKHAKEIFADMDKAADQYNSEKIKQIIDKFIMSLTEEEVKKFFPEQYEDKDGKLIVLSNIEKAAMRSSKNVERKHNGTAWPAISAFIDRLCFIEGEPAKSCCLMLEERVPARFVLSQISIERSECMILADIEKAVIQGDNEAAKRVIKKVIESLTREDMARLFLNQCEIKEGKFTIFSDIEEALDDLNETAIFQLALDSDLETLKYFMEQFGKNEKAQHCLSDGKRLGRGSIFRAIEVANAIAAASCMEDGKDEAQCTERAQILLLNGVQQLQYDGRAEDKSSRELYWQALENSAALVKHCQPQLEQIGLYHQYGGKRTRPDAATPSTRISQPECKIGNEENISQIQ